MQAVTRSTLLAFQSVAATLLSVAPSSDPIFTFGGDAETRKRLEALPEFPSTDQVLAAFDVPADAVGPMRSAVAEKFSTATISKALEAVTIAREERAKRKQFSAAGFSDGDEGGRRGIDVGSLLS